MGSLNERIQVDLVVEILIKISLISFESIKIFNTKIILGDILELEALVIEVRSIHLQDGKRLLTDIFLIHQLFPELKSFIVVRFVNCLAEKVPLFIHLGLKFFFALIFLLFSVFKCLFYFSQFFEVYLGLDNWFRMFCILSLD